MRSAGEQPAPRAVAREEAFRGRLLRIVVDTLRWPDGRETAREMVLHPGAVCVLPLTEAGRILFVTQYRHPAGRRLLELPAGTLEEGESPEETARRELEEEVGMRPRRLRPLGGFYVAPGYSTEFIHLFEATELEPASRRGDEDEDIEVLELAPAEALARVERGEICDGKSIIALLIWEREQRSGRTGGELR